MLVYWMVWQPQRSCWTHWKISSIFLGPISPAGSPLNHCFLQLGMNRQIPSSLQYLIDMCIYIYTYLDFRWRRGQMYPESNGACPPVLHVMLCYYDTTWNRHVVPINPQKPGWAESNFCKISNGSRSIDDLLIVMFQPAMLNYQRVAPRTSSRYLFRRPALWMQPSAGRVRWFHAMIFGVSNDSWITHGWIVIRTFWVKKELTSRVDQPKLSQVWVLVSPQN